MRARSAVRRAGNAWLQAPFFTHLPVTVTVFMRTNPSVRWVTSQSWNEVCAEARNSATAVVVVRSMAPCSPAAGRDATAPTVGRQWGHSRAPSRQELARFLELRGQVLVEHEVEAVLRERLLLGALARLQHHLDRLLPLLVRLEERVV